MNQNSIINHSPHFPDPGKETADKLLQSANEAKDMKERELRCPICGYRIAGIFEDQKGHIRVKCRKCKFEGILNLAYFRSSKFCPRNPSGIRFPSMRMRGRR